MRNFSWMTTAALMLLATAFSFAGDATVAFGKGQWNPEQWIMVKSPRWPHCGGWVQKDTHIENTVPSDATKKEMLGKRAGETYTSMLWKEKLSGNVSVSVTMEFDDRMAPLIVLAPEIGKSDKGYPEYREHYEIVLYDLGLNVWHHFYKDGKPYWKKAGYFRIPFKPGQKYKVTVKVNRTSRGTMLTVKAGDYEFGMLDDSIPDEFYIGVTGCEGVNRFYDFEVKSIPAKKSK